MNAAIHTSQEHRLTQGEPNSGDIGMFIKDILHDQLVAIPLTVIWSTYKARRFPGWTKVSRFAIQEAINELMFSRQVECDHVETVRRYRLRPSVE